MAYGHTLQQCLSCCTRTWAWGSVQRAFRCAVLCHVWDKSGRPPVPSALSHLHGLDAPPCRCKHRHPGLPVARHRPSQGACVCGRCAPVHWGRRQLPRLCAAIDECSELPGARLNRGRSIAARFVTFATGLLGEVYLIMGVPEIAVVFHSTG